MEPTWEPPTAETAQTLRRDPLCLLLIPFDSFVDDFDQATLPAVDQVQSSQADSHYTLAEIEEEFGKEVRGALDCLTKNEEKRETMDSETYYLEEFIPKAADNDIARKVKRADIQDNLDLNRLSEITEDDFDRITKYHQALQKL